MDGGLLQMAESFGQLAKSGHRVRNPMCMLTRKTIRNNLNAQAVVLQSKAVPDIEARKQMVRPKVQGGIP
jgi:hypothetical protein